MSLELREWDAGRKRECVFRGSPKNILQRKFSTLVVGKEQGRRKTKRYAVLGADLAGVADGFGLRGRENSNFISEYERRKI